jgi:hypothetical protein
MTAPLPHDSPDAPGTLLAAEQTTIHTQLLRLTLAIEESRAYWEHVDTSLSLAQRAEIAFEQRWFGTRSAERVRLLLANFALRYDAFPGALGVLRRWPRMEASTRALVCHWHLQLADPIYRRFTGEFLVERRSRLAGASAAPAITRDLVLRWVSDLEPGRWSAGTLTQFASKLLSGAHEAGLIEGTRDPRPLRLPRVPDLALVYCLHLLREVRFLGTLHANPYLASVGLGPESLDVRLRALPGVHHRRMGDLHEFTWDHPSLSQWGESLHE